MSIESAIKEIKELREFDEANLAKEQEIKGLTHEDRMQRILNEWQLCPKCSGEGTLITGIISSATNIYNSVSTCDLCNGKKIISKVTGEPPK